MSENEVYLWDQSRAIQHIKNKYMVCRVCGQSVPYFPPEGPLQHTLTHAERDERNKIEEMIAWVTSKEPARFQAEIARRTFADPKFIEYALKNGFVTRVRGEG